MAARLPPADFAPAHLSAAHPAAVYAAQHRRDFGAVALGCLPGPTIAGRGLLKTAILEVFYSLNCMASFTGLASPVWDGWASAPALLWRLPPAVTELHFASASLSLRDHEAGCFVGEMCLELADAGELEKRLDCPLKRSDDPDAAQRQDWEFRLPGFDGLCYWEPSRPETLTPDDDWQSLVSPQHLSLLEDSLGPGFVPPYLLARIERYRQHKTGRPRPRRVRLF